MVGEMAHGPKRKFNFTVTVMDIGGPQVITSSVTIFARSVDSFV